MRRFVPVAIALAVGCGKTPEERYGKPPTLDPAIASAARQKMTELQALSQQLAGRDATIDTTWVPRPDLGACPVKAPFPTEVVYPGADVPNPALILSGAVHAVLSDLATALEGGTYAEHSAGSGFEGGLVTGRAYLWSASAGKVVCVGDVMAESSTNISYSAENDSFDAYYGRNDRGEIRAALDDDLHGQVQRAIFTAFEHAAGPAEARRTPKKAR
jgi:hypothetical protein